MRRVLFTAATALGLFGLMRPARADEWNKVTKVTFGKPVGVPGKTLPAGTYIFRLVDSQSDRNVVQILNTRQSEVFGTFLTIGDYRPKSTGKTVITFGENCANLPEYIKAWWYPGDTTGNRFVYPRDEAMKIAKACKVPVPHVPKPVIAAVAKAKPIRPVTAPAPPPQPAVTALKSATVTVAKPEAVEVEVAYVKEDVVTFDGNDSGYDGDKTP